MDKFPAISAHSRSLSVVVPVYNESECFQPLLTRLLSLRDRLRDVELEYIFVDDGSNDGTTVLLATAANEYSCVKMILLSRNFGHQAALTAGVDRADGDWVCIIDGDLQDPPELIPEMLAKASEGYDIVYAQRRSRDGETRFKKATASLFYRLITVLCKIEIPPDTGDFRLVSRRAILAFRQMRETHRFIRGMVPWLGFRSAPFLYDRQARYAGSTKWPIRKMLHFAMDALFSFSNFPLRLAVFLGCGMTVFSFIGLLVILYFRFMTTFYVPGISAVIFLILLTSGMHFVVLGIFGEYIGRIFEQSKQRPLYIIAATANLPNP
ncbi:MAG: glycosyltransferase family 2 protein [bacterium]